MWLTRTMVNKTDSVICKYCTILVTKFFVSLELFREINFNVKLFTKEVIFTEIFQKTMKLCQWQCIVNFLFFHNVILESKIPREVKFRNFHTVIVKVGTYSFAFHHNNKKIIIIFHSTKKV